MASRDCTTLPANRVIRLSAIALLGAPFEGVMYKGNFVHVQQAEAQMTREKVKVEEKEERLQKTYWGLHITLVSGYVVPVLTNTKNEAESWHHTLKGLLIN